MNRAIYTSENDRWATPEWLFAWLDAQLRFTVDVCAERWNRKLTRFFSVAENALLQSWARERAWHNPPYSQVEAWMRRARRAALVEGAMVASLVPARVDTEWWDRYVLHRDGAAGHMLDGRYDPDSRTWWVDREGCSTALHFVKGRVDFDTPPNAVKRGESTAPFPSAIVIYVPTGMPVPQRTNRSHQLDPWLTRLWPTGDSATSKRLHALAGRSGRVQNNTPSSFPEASFSSSAGAPSFAAQSNPNQTEHHDGKRAEGRADRNRRHRARD